MNYGNNTKTSFQKVIKGKQSLFNRMKRRYKASNCTAERCFLKTEATRICTELKQCCKQWKNCNFGGCVWITKGFTVTNFCAGAKPVCNTGTRKSYSKSNTRSTSRTNSRRPASRTSRTTSRKSYVAW